MLQIFNFIKKQPTPDSKKDKKERIEVWEISGEVGKNDFPQQLLQNIYNSPVGSAAIDLWQEYTEGDGFVDNEIGKTKINKNDNLNDLHALLSADISSMWGCSVHVSYNLKGEIVSYRHLPFESARLGELDDNGVTDRIYFNPYYGTPDFETDFTKWFYTFNSDPLFVVQQMKDHKILQGEKKVKFAYPGQVFWFSIERPLARIYPQPFYFSAISWFQVDAAIQKFHSRNIDNNFLLSVLINKFGDPDAPAGEADDDGNFNSTVGKEFSKSMENFTGSENGGSVLVNWYKRVEEQADITAFPTNSHDDLFVNLQNLVSDQISIGTKTPRILLGIATAGKLGDTQDILNSVRVMQSRTLRMREALTRIYEKLFVNIPNQDFAIRNINPFDILPDWVISSLTKSQRDKYISENFNINFEQQTVKKATDDPVQAAAQASLKGSVGGVQGILSIQQGVSSGLTTRESALEVLQLIYGFSLEESERLLGTPKGEAIEQTARTLNTGENGN